MLRGYEEEKELVKEIENKWLMDRMKIKIV